MNDFTVVIEARSAVCYSGRRPKSRLYAFAPDVAFYVVGSVGNRRPELDNIIMNKCIELHVPLISLRYQKPPVKPAVNVTNKKQLKLL